MYIFQFYMDLPVLEINKFLNYLIMPVDLFKYEI